MSKIFYSIWLLIGLSFSQISLANINHNDKSSLYTSTQKQNSKIDVHVVLISPDNTFSKNTTPQQVGEYLGQIISVVTDTFNKNKIENNIMIDINIDSEKQDFNLSYTGNIDEKQTPIFKDMMINLYKIKKISTKEPLHMQLYFVKKDK